MYTHSKYLFTESIRRIQRDKSLLGVLLFPISIVLITAMISYSLENILLFDKFSVLSAVSVFFMFIGYQIGVVFLADVELINNFVSDTTLLHYVAQFEPLSNEASFVSFFIIETVTYSLLFILPVSVGIMFGTSVFLINVHLLISAYVISFLVGTAFLFFISSYRKILSVPFTVVTGVSIFYALSYLFSISIVESLPTGILFSSNTTMYGILSAWLGVCIAGILLGFITHSKNRGTSQSRGASMHSLLTKLIKRQPRRRNSQLRLSSIVMKIITSLVRSSGGVGRILAMSFIFWAVSLSLLQGLSNVFATNPYYLVGVSVIVPAFSYIYYHLIISNSPLSDYELAPVEKTDIISAEAYVFYLLAIISWSTAASLTILAKHIYKEEFIVALVISTGLYIFMYWFNVTICRHDKEALFDGKTYLVYGLVLTVAILPPLLLSTLFVLWGVVTSISTFAVFYIFAGKLLKIRYVKSL